MNINRMNTLFGAMALIGVTGAAQAGIASAIMLDDYDSTPNMGAGGVGDYSTIMLNNPFNQSADFSLEAALTIGSDTGAVVFNSGIGVEQSGVISYSNSGAGLNLDAIDSGIQGFEIDFAMVDLSFTTQIVMYSFDDMGNAVGSARWSVLVEAGTNVIASWSLADFIIVQGDFDATNIDQLEVIFNTEDNPTASLDFIATEFRAVVPASGAWALLGLGGLVATKRRR